MNIFRKFFFLSVCFFILPLSVFAVEIKFASLAPEGSTWVKVLQEWNQELMEKSKGELKFRVYSGGVAGDEKDVIRKIRLGQLHAGGFTGVGLGEIAPEVRILDAPFLFRNTEEVDFILNTFEKEFFSAFRQKGYVLLGWAEVGFVYFFSSEKASDFKDFKRMKMWAWEGDPIAEALFKSLDISPVSLSIADVMTSLQTGLINGVYSSPMAALALQWTSRTKYLLNFKLANASGAVLVSGKLFDSLTQDLRALLLETGKKHLRHLTELSRAENLSAMDFLKQNHVEMTEPLTPEGSETIEKAGTQAREMLIGKLYQKEFLEQVEQALAQYRSTHPSKGK